jgi:hypothetical protein
MILDSNWHRLTYWLGQNWPGVAQAACAAATVWITYSLVKMNKRYIRLTQEQLNNSQRQTEILVQPNLDITSLVEGLEWVIDRRIYRATITVKNKGAYPVQITEARVCSGLRTAVQNSFEHKLHDLAERVIPAGESVREEFNVDKWLTNDEDLGPFHDFLATTIACKDLLGLCPGEYHYQPLAGLSYRSTERVLGPASP